MVHAGVEDRLNTFTNFIRAHGLWSATYAQDYIQEHIGTRSAAATQVQRLLDLDAPPTALFCASDVLALGAFASVWQRGKRVPDDLSIVGFDDIEEATDLYPPLTTVRQPVEQMARSALTLLRTLINAQVDSEPLTAEQKRIIVTPEFVQRLSCSVPHL